MDKKIKSAERPRKQAARPIDQLFAKTYFGLGKSWVFIKKTRIRTWQGIFVMALAAGIAVSTVFISVMDYYDSIHAAAGEAKLSLRVDGDTDQAPGVLAVQKNGAFSVDVILDALENEVVAVKADLHFDASKFRLDSCSTADSPFGVNADCTTSSANPFQIVVDNRNSGEIIITQAKTGHGVQNASGHIATLNFTALQTVAPSAANITLLYNGVGQYNDSDAIVYGNDGADILNEVGNATITVAPPTCTSFTYSAYGSCQSNSKHYRSITSSLPAGCTGGSPITEESCIYTPPTVTCTDFTYSAYGDCQSNGKQSRSITSSSPQGCTGGNSVTTLDCEYDEPDPEPPIITDGEIDINDPKIKIGSDDSKELNKSKTVYSDNNKFYFKGKSIDLANGKVAIYEGGDKKAETTVGADGSWKLTAKPKKDGKYEYRLKYYDGNGQEIGQSSKYSVRVDTKSPQFTDLPSLLNKRPGDVLWWKATDSDRIDYYKYYFNGKTKETTKDSFVIPTNTPKGLQYLRVKIYDRAGNTEVRNIVVRVH
ncbi:MAG: cohesin domain-containing protein [Parcubacteria group bacterium]